MAYEQRAGRRPRSAIRLANLPGEAAVPPGAARLLSAWHCESGLAAVRRPAPQKQSCARRRPAAIGVIQMSPTRPRTATPLEDESDRSHVALYLLSPSEGVPIEPRAAEPVKLGETLQGTSCLVSWCRRPVGWRSEWPARRGRERQRAKQPPVKPSSMSSPQGSGQQDRGTRRRRSATEH
jgi:hypothetical protein